MEYLDFSAYAGRGLQTRGEKHTWVDMKAT